MLRVNFSAYNTYVTDSLYRWDKNQKLVISGLNLSVNPEVRFTNEIMDKSIVRQSVCEDGVLTVSIPNSLLQYPYTIKAYIGIYEGDLFKTIECVNIPVIAQERPLDYVLTDSDGEIYSFNALDNKVEHSLEKYNQASGQLQESIENYQLAREEFIEGLKEANKSFKLSKIYTSIAQMNAGYATDNVPLYGFVLINTGNDFDKDTGKLFVKTETVYTYVSYLVGEKGKPFTYEDFTPEQLADLKGDKGDKGDTGNSIDEELRVNLRNGSFTVAKTKEISLGETLVFENVTNNKIAYNFSAGVYLVVGVNPKVGTLERSYTSTGIIAIGTSRTSNDWYEAPFGDGHMTYSLSASTSGKANLTLNDTNGATTVYITKIANYMGT